ncbi:F-box protein At4g22280-like isoform X1 [Lotus japonicus]|uniref:F-box protein At4g22280-like isoform X1 n=1 Tax=Lotus japonicus TaxID=34305 RepID=UPI002586983D|nr:F-box protein At4g22280-like isoform X1 [Lotus japonicus]XP_057425518.1 F-box protein At4g22280-like isoform X1 [Lotus japonicus]
MSNSTDEMLIAPKAKRGRNSENETEIEDNKDRLSDLHDCILLHILSFLKAKYAVQTCMLSKRWKDLWKRLPNLILLSADFDTFKFFTKFVSTILTRRDGSTALHALDFERMGCIQPPLIKRIVNYAVSHNVQQLGIYVECDMQHLLPCIFTCHTLTSLKLIVYPKGYSDITLFPKSLNLPALTTLHLGNFTFCSNDNDRADPFSAFNRLNSLIIDHCKLKDARTLCISGMALVNLTLCCPTLDFYTIELSTPCLYRFTCADLPSQYLCGSGLSSVKEVNIDADILLSSPDPPLILLSWLQDFVNITSLTVTTNTLQVLFLVPDILKIKLPSLANLKRLKIKREPLSYMLTHVMRGVRLKKAATESRKEAAKLRKEADILWKTRRLRTAPFTDEIVDFLVQNAPSAEVEIIDCLM